MESQEHCVFSNGYNEHQTCKHIYKTSVLEMRIKGSSGGELYRSLSGTPSSTLSRQVHGWGWRFTLSFHCLFFYAQHFSMSGSHWTSVGFRLDRWSVSFLCKISVWSEERLPLSWLLAVCCTNFQLSAVCFNIAVFLKVQALSKEVDNIYTSTDRVVKNIHLIHFQGFSKSGSGTILDIMKY